VQRAIHQPIIVFGTGRSGTTIFHRILSGHPDVAWLSSLCNRHATRPLLNRYLMHCLNVPFLGGLLRRKWRPSEAYRLWERSCPGFSNPVRDLFADDLTPVSEARICAVLSQMTTSARHRLLIKITGWPRLLYLRALFPDARFIHVHRDPPAVVSSILEVPWWDGWRGPSSWRRGPLPRDLETLWNDQGQSFVALAAIEYVLFERAYRRCQQAIPRDQILEIAYASLCADPILAYRTVLAHCGLNWSARFERHIKRHSLRNTDYKWRENLSEHQQTVLIQTLERARERETAKIPAERSDQD
jgi:hypothetical protein